MGELNTASAYGAVSIGGSSNTASGEHSFTFANFAEAPARNQVTIGQYNTTLAGTSNAWVATEPLFVIGNGTAPGARSNAVTVLKNGKVGVGTTSPGAVFDVYGTGTSHSAMIVPRDTSGNRPTSAVNGMIRDNTTSNAFEEYS